MQIKIEDPEQYRQRRTPCPACGTWKCGNCGHKRSRMALDFEGVRTCPRCQHTKGEMLPTHHSIYGIYLDHVETWIEQQK